MVLVADTAPSPLARTAFQSMQVFRLHIQVAISTMRPSQASKKLSAECSAKLKLRNSSTTDVTMSVRRCSRSISASIGRRGSPRARQRETCCARAMRPARKRGMERHRRVSQTVPWSPFTSMSATMLSRGKSLSQHGRHARTFGRSALAAQCQPKESVQAPGLALWRKTTSSSVSSPQPWAAGAPGSVIAHVDEPCRTTTCSCVNGRLPGVVVTSMVQSARPGWLRKRGTSSSSV